MLERLSYPDRKSWLEGRNGGLGASDAGAIVGLSPWMSSAELWQIKTGQKRDKDLSGNEAVEKGVRLEEYIRQLYMAKHPEYRLEYHAFDILRQSERPWLCATLDGELIETIPNDAVSDVIVRRGILEVKTSTLAKSKSFDEWQSGVPRNYYCQILHQMLATGWDFVRLVAFLMNLEGDRCLWREYEFERCDSEADMSWLLEREERFMRCVTNRTLPPMTLTL